MSRVKTYLTNEIIQINPNTEVPIFSNVLVGGTFDHMHNGHIKLLTLACMSATKHLYVAICSDDMVKCKSYSQYIQDQRTRYENVTSILNFIKPNLDKTVIIINNPCEPSLIFKQNLDAIVLSSETCNQGLVINDERSKKQLRRLTILEIKRLRSDTSSTSIRQSIHSHYN